MGVRYRRWKSHAVYSVRRRRRHRICLRLLAVIAAVCYLTVFVHRRAVPMFYAMAKNRLYDSAAALTEAAIVESDLVRSVRCEELVTIISDEQGRVFCVQPNTVLFHRLRSDLARRINEKLSDQGNCVLQMPLGSFSGSPFLAACGPAIPIPVLPDGNVRIRFESAFSSVAINRTRYAVSLVAEVNQNLFFPSETLDVDFVLSLPLTETVFAGEVPQSYLLRNFDAEQETSLAQE